MRLMPLFLAAALYFLMLTSIGGEWRIDNIWSDPC